MQQGLPITRGVRRTRGDFRRSMVPECHVLLNMLRVRHVIAKPKCRRQPNENPPPVAKTGEQGVQRLAPRRVIEPVHHLRGAAFNGESRACCFLLLLRNSLNFDWTARANNCAIDSPGQCRLHLGSMSHIRTPNGNLTNFREIRLKMGAASRKESVLSM
jgi:hypothetical protein